MGAFVIFDVGFATKKDRVKFEKLFGILKKDILVDENSKSAGFAWTFLRNPALNPIYNMGFMGYAEPKDILKTCLKKKIGIKFLSWIPINDKNNIWEKIRGRW